MLGMIWFLVDLHWVGTNALEDTLHFLGNPPFKHGKRISCNLFSFTASQAITLGRLFQEMFFLNFTIDEMEEREARREEGREGRGVGRRGDATRLGFRAEGEGENTYESKK